MAQSSYITTRRFPAALVARVGDLVPGFARSFAINHADDGEYVTATAHRNEIHLVRRAIQIAKGA